MIFYDVREVEVLYILTELQLIIIQYFSCVWKPNCCHYHDPSLCQRRLVKREIPRLALGAPYDSTSGWFATVYLGLAIIATPNLASLK